MHPEFDNSNIIIYTDRVILRSWKNDDLNDFFEYASIPGVGEMAGWKHHQDIKISKVVLKSFIDSKEVFAIELKANHKVIGSIGLHHSWINEDDDYKHLKGRELGYVLSKDYWGKGLMPEAIKAVIDYCFKELDYDVLSCGHFDFNHQSQRVIEKLGFHLIKSGMYDAKLLDKTFPIKHYLLYNPYR